MPILDSELFAYPPSLFKELAEGLIGMSPSDGEWMVVHTRSRAEKALARWLLAASARFFLPQYKRQARVNGRVQTSFVPLFPGYVFVHGGVNTRELALASNKVVRCIPVPDQVALTADLSAVFRLMTGEHALTPVLDLPPGAAVELIDGPFAGLTGRVVGAGVKERLVVEVRILRQGVAVELGRAVVRPLTENGAATCARIALIRG